MRPEETPQLFEKLWTVTDLAEHLQASKKTIYEWVHLKKIPFLKVGSLLRFRPSEIEKWLSSKGGSHVDQ